MSTCPRIQLAMFSYPRSMNTQYMRRLSRHMKKKHKRQWHSKGERKTKNISCLKNKTKYEFDKKKNIIQRPTIVSILKIYEKFKRFKNKTII